MLTNESSLNNEFMPRRKVTYSEKKSDDPFYSEENLTRLKKSMEQLERGEVVTKTFDELRQMVNG